ncbi:hypothetical protein KFE25_005904 [Diacronema lutheri]|uniref:Uncharacterized protein n=1 Tax=Diacronema lutheri TaxID=2081491 RepID=A0A8J6CEA0_DIALT|nr:hypothetical protein KFE25_005904 [Diacronema lutheri]
MADDAHPQGEELRRALALNRMMRDEAQAALRQLDDALKLVSRRLKETRVELRLAQVHADDEARELARTRLRARGAGESFFVSSVDGFEAPSPNTDTLRMRRLLSGMPLGGRVDRSGVWPKAWRDELGVTVGELLRAQLLERSGQRRDAPLTAAPVPSSEPGDGRLVPFAPPARQPAHAAVGDDADARAWTVASWTDAAEVGPVDCARLLERIVAERVRISSMPLDELVRASRPLDDAFWAHAATALGARLGGNLSERPTAADCARQWGTHPHNPLVDMSVDWSAEEDARLVELARDGSRSWEEIATLHAHGKPRSRPLIELLKRYQRALNPCMTRRAWSADEDRLLCAAVARHGRGQWQAISAHLPRRTNAQCMLRYMKTADPHISRARWEPHEDALLEASVNVHSSEQTRARTAPLAASRACGVAWVKVQLTVPHRTDAQCRERFCNATDPLIPRVDGARLSWAPDDDARLGALVNGYWRPGSGCGSWRLVPWSRIAERMAPLAVTDADVRRRFFAHLATAEQMAEYDELNKLRLAILPSNYTGRLGARPSARTSAHFRLMAAADAPAAPLALLGPPAAEPTRSRARRPARTRAPPIAPRVAARAAGAHQPPRRARRAARAAPPADGGPGAKRVGGMPGSAAGDALAAAVAAACAHEARTNAASEAAAPTDVRRQARVRSPAASGGRTKRARTDGARAPLPEESACAASAVTPATAATALTRARKPSMRARNAAR